MDNDEIELLDYVETDDDSVFVMTKSKKKRTLHIRNMGNKIKYKITK